MAGDLRQGAQDAGIPVSRRCSIPFCGRDAVASCFECERFCCARHLSAVSLAITACPIHVQVCPDCLLRYRNDPDICALLTIDV